MIAAQDYGFTEGYEHTFSVEPPKPVVIFWTDAPDPAKVHILAKRAQYVAHIAPYTKKATLANLLGNVARLSFTDRVSLPKGKSIAVPTEVRNPAHLIVEATRPESLKDWAPWYLMRKADDLRIAVHLVLDYRRPQVREALEKRFLKDGFSGVPEKLFGKRSLRVTRYASNWQAQQLTDRDLCEAGHHHDHEHLTCESCPEQWEHFDDRDGARAVLPPSVTEVLAESSRMHNSPITLETMAALYEHAATYNRRERTPLTTTGTPVGLEADLEQPYGWQLEPSSHPEPWRVGLDGYCLDCIADEPTVAEQLARRCPHEIFGDTSIATAVLDGRYKALAERWLPSEDAKLELEAPEDAALRRRLVQAMVNRGTSKAPTRAKQIAAEWLPEPEEVPYVACCDVCGSFDELVQYDHADLCTTCSAAA